MKKGTPDAGDSPSEGKLTQWPVVAPTPDLVPLKLTPQTVLIQGATVMTAAGPTIKNGSVLLQDGKILKVSEQAIEPPEGALIVDGRGKFVTPGLIDVHSHLGVYAVPGVKAHADGNEMTSPTTPQVHAIHSVWPQDPGFERALQGGVTALHIMPGSANVVGGRTISLQMHAGVSARAMAFPGAPTGVKMACGENPKRVHGGKGRLPSTRMGTMAVFRSMFHKAQRAKSEYEDYVTSYNKWVDKGSDASKRPKAPKRDLAMETLVGVLRGEVLVHIHCYRADEMVQLLELAHTNNFKVRTFHHAVEAYKIRELLGRVGTSVATWADWWGFKIEAHDAIPQNAALVDAAPGGRGIIHSDSPEDIQRLNQEAAKAYWAAKHKGMNLTQEDALKWITINPAWAMGVDKLTGSLEQGKRADVVVWSAHPLSVYAQAEIVWVEGVREFDRARDKARLPRSDFELEQLPTQEVSP